MSSFREEILKEHLRDTENFKLDDEENITVIQVQSDNIIFCFKSSISFLFQVKGPINFLTLGYVKTLIQLQLVSNKSQVQRKVPYKKNKVLPSSVLEVNIVDEFKEGRSSDDEEFIETKRVCKNPVLNLSEESDQEDRDDPLRLEIILDLSSVIWLDVAGCELISWLSEHRGLDALVVESHLEVGACCYVVSRLLSMFDVAGNSHQVGRTERYEVASVQESDGRLVRRGPGSLLIPVVKLGCDCVTYR